MNTIGDRIRDIRKTARLNQKDLGLQLGVGATTVSGYERNEKSPNLGNMVKIADLGGVTLDWLITGREPERQTTNGMIAATIEPGSRDKSRILIEAGEKATNRNVHLLQIVEWLDIEFGKNDEQALFFYEDLKDRYPSFAEFMEKKRPGANNLVAEPEKKYNNSQ